MTGAKTAGDPAVCGSAGVTLVELLVVLAIFGLLSTVLFGGFHYATRVVTAGTARLDRVEQLAIAAGFLRNQLADIRPFPAAASAGPGMVAFAGQAAAVRFVAASPAYLAPGGLHALRIALEAAGPEKQLVLRWEPMPGAGAQDGPDIGPSVLLGGIASATFAYFGPRAPGQAPAWYPSWTGNSGLPSLIRLRMTFADGAPAPDVVVAVRTAEAAFQ